MNVLKLALAPVAFGLAVAAHAAGPVNNEIGDVDFHAPVARPRAEVQAEAAQRMQANPDYAVKNGAGGYDFKPAAYRPFDAASQRAAADEAHRLAVNNETGLASAPAGHVTLPRLLARRGAH